jgi:predicted LPLAT superfamily acyltransferase
MAWDGKTRGNVLGYSIFIFLLKNFGVTPAYALLRFVALYFVFFTPKATPYIYKYFRKLGYSPVKSAVNVYRNYYVFGQTIIDKVCVMAGFSNKFTYDFNGEENIVEIGKGGKGGILLSSHIGNWEVAGYLFKRLSMPINIVMFDEEHEKIKHTLENVTGKRSMNIIVIKPNDLSHIFEIKKRLSDNELICLHGDRFVKGSKTVTANFLGEDALFPYGPFHLAAYFKVPYAFVYGFKASSTHYALSTSTPSVCTNGYEAILNEYVSSMENLVRKYPLQWFNYYDFWEK